MQAGIQTGTTKKSAFAYTLRPLAESDIPAFIAFNNECARLEEAVEPVTLDEWVEWYHNPMNHEHNTLAVLQDEAGGEGRIIGNSSFGMNPPDTRSWGWLHVHPDYRNNGVGTALYAEYIRQGDEAGALERLVTPSRQAILLIAFLEKRGHVVERWFWDMQLPAEQAVGTASWPEGFHVRTFVHNQDEALLTHVRNVTFAQHYGSVPRTVEEMTYRTTQQGFYADGLFFAFNGDEVAGFCYTSRDPREWERRDEKVGHIQLLGVMPDYRGRSLGRALLLTGVNYLREYVDLVELGVEGKNSKALALYESAGFHQHKAWANMLLSK